MKKLFETKRTIVREWEDYDLYNILEFLTSDVFEYIDWKPIENTSVASKIISAWQEKYKNPNYTNEIIDKYVRTYKTQYAIMIKDGSKAIGTLGIHWKDDTVEIGYVLSSHYKNNGYTTEIVKGAIEYFKPKAKSITATTCKENIGSWRVMEKAGMEFSKECEDDDDPTKTMIVYQVKGAKGAK